MNLLKKVKILYISDLDGTLFNPQATLSSKTIEIVNNFIEKGNFFSIATARSKVSAEPLLSPLNLNIPYILHNGSFIFDPLQRKYIWEKYIPIDIAWEIIKDYEKMNLHPLIYCNNGTGEEKVYFTKISNKSHQQCYQDRIQHQDKRFEKVEKIPISIKNISEINLILAENEASQIYDYVSNKYQQHIHMMNDIYCSGYTWIEIMHPKANKQDALYFLKNLLNFDKIVCFGDNVNDIPMFQISDESYAVGNAVEELKKISTSIIDTNKNDGVANFLKEKEE